MRIELTEDDGRKIQFKTSEIACVRGGEGWTEILCGGTLFQVKEPYAEVFSHLRPEFTHIK